jgi:hypothetical protein
VLFAHAGIGLFGAAYTSDLTLLFLAGVPVLIAFDDPVRT